METRVQEQVVRSISKDSIEQVDALFENVFVEDSNNILK